ncbi:MAG TPA: 3-deoxy-7-phosphoheptulonate synthase [Candidatus Omnitrophota bacterium]|nr:3-deoxy-7-phosphoheptulonate synthase [Candidatus Omnitrophota bacterium]HRK62347.1 3-deoxy-7-phosphoheptulonate synthase [Candidatus Omnitrophota bacterium]
MAFIFKNRIPNAEEVLSEIPLKKDLAQIKAKRDKEIRDVFEGKSDKFILVIGPCSADNADAVCQYVSRLRKVQEKVQDKVLLIPRMYTNKPRTTGVGYKGMAHQPDPNEPPNIVAGIKAIRRMHIRALEESGLPAADEMLYPGNSPFLADLLGYVAIGARSVENQQHRLTVSGMDIPVGLKNPTSGDLSVMLNGIYAAQQPHVFIYSGWEVETTGNPLAHAILRGASNPLIGNVPNYHYEDLINTMEYYIERKLANPAILVDTSHANSGKKFEEQPRIAKEILLNRKFSDILRKSVKGIMIESYLVEGTQKIGDGVFGKSITDPCLGWADSEKLIYDIADLL